MTIRENFKVKNQTLNLQQKIVVPAEPAFQKVSGHVFGWLTDVRTGEKTHFDLGKNVIVQDASVLMGILLKSPSTLTGGLQYLAVGTGAIGWNLQQPPAATSSQTQLEAELFRKTFSKTAYIKTDGSGDESSTPTNIVDYTTIFAESEAVGPLVEMGLFGGNATGVPNSGYMFNYKTFPVINKSATSTLTFVWRITT